MISSGRIGADCVVSDEFNLTIVIDLVVSERTLVSHNIGVSVETSQRRDKIGRWTKSEPKKLRDSPNGLACQQPKMSVAK